MIDRPLHGALPRLVGGLSFESLGEFPTPVQDLTAGLALRGAPLFAKRDDRSSPVYGGNKVRTLEVLFGEAKARGASRIYSTGAFGTNHGLATVLHAPRVALEPGVLLFPQPASACAVENLKVTLSLCDHVRAIPHWSALPFGMLRTSMQEGQRTTIMMPGGATATGGLGYVNAALELALQVERGELPAPDSIVLGAGSNCTSAGLLVGLRLATKLGIGFRSPPRVRAIRVTPWPVTSKLRIVSLAVDIAAELARLAHDPSLAFERGVLAGGLEVDGSELGWGYGYETRRGQEAVSAFREAFAWELDTTYSAKAAAAATHHVKRAKGPVLFWSTKSTSALPALDQRKLAEAPASMRRWLRSAERSLARKRGRAAR